MPEPPSRLESSSIQASVPGPLPSADLAGKGSLTVTSIRTQWTLALTQHNDFELHAALRTFKRLIRALRIPEEESSRSTTKNLDEPPPAPFQILQPAEVALLYINMGSINAYLGQNYLASEAFEEARVLDPTSAIAWFGLGVTKYHCEDLSASRKAFKRCKRCFVAENIVDGKTYRKEEIVYNVWPGLPQPINTSAANAQSSDISLDQFKGIMSSRLPNNQWTLECERAEWNYRIVKEKSESLKYENMEPFTRPMTGIPAAVIFDLDTYPMHHTLNTQAHASNNDIGVHDSKFSNNIFEHTATSPTNTNTNNSENTTKKSNTSNALKRTWTNLQDIFSSNREPGTRSTKRNRLPGWGSGAATSPQSHPSNLAFGHNHDDTFPPPTTQPDLSCNHLFIEDSPRPSPPWPPRALNRADSGGDDDVSDGEEMGIMANDRLAEIRMGESSTTPAFRRPRWDATAASSKHSRVPRIVNTVDGIEESLAEAGNGMFIPSAPFLLTCLQSSNTSSSNKYFSKQALEQIYTNKHHFGAYTEPISQPPHSLLRRRDSGEISPRDTSGGIYNDFFQNVDHHDNDFRLFDNSQPQPLANFLLRSPPQVAADRMHGSFSTEAISDLSASMALFPDLHGGMSGEQSRAPSRAGNRSPLEPLGEEKEDGEEAGEKEESPEGGEESKTEGQDAEGGSEIGEGVQADYEPQADLEDQPLVTITAPPADQPQEPWVQEYIGFLGGLIPAEPEEEDDGNSVFSFPSPPSSHHSHSSQASQSWDSDSDNEQATTYPSTTAAEVAASLRAVCHRINLLTIPYIDHEFDDESNPDPLTQLEFDEDGTWTEESRLDARRDLLRDRE
ncbi:MAG: hypothetical protein Q9168_006247, partial [Polycauliona sp. 1 TL-2023]